MTAVYYRKRATMTNSYCRQKALKMCSTLTIPIKQEVSLTEEYNTCEFVTNALLSAETVKQSL